MAVIKVQLPGPTPGAHLRGHLPGERTWTWLNQPLLNFTSASFRYCFVIIYFAFVLTAFDFVTLLMLISFDSAVAESINLFNLIAISIVVLVAITSSCISKFR